MKFTIIVVKFIVLAKTVIISVSSDLLDCEPRAQPNNGQVVFMASKNWKRAVEVYQCDSGYILTGQTKHTCIRGEWSGNVPLCIYHNTTGFKNIINSVQGWFSFRHLLKFDAKKNVLIKKKQLTNNRTEHIFQLPKYMIRDSTKELLEGDYDLSCLFKKRHGKHFLRAPKLPHAHVVKYLKKKNNVYPYNKYLEAVYYCVKGYFFENPSQNRLYCNKGQWTGKKPLCISKTTPMTTYQMECYIKCPPDKNVSLANGTKSIDFKVEQPNTNYDWARFGMLSSGWNKNSTTVLVPGVYVITYSVRDQEDMDIASCRTTVRVIDNEVPTVQDCPLYLLVIINFSKNNTVSWPEPKFFDNIGVTKIVKTMEPGQFLSPGIYNVLYIAMDASNNEAVCNFTIEVKDQATVGIENKNINKTVIEV